MDTIRLLEWFSGKESTCQCRRHGFDLWSRKDPTCRRVTKSKHLNYWICSLETGSHNYWSPYLPQLEKSPNCNKDLAELKINKYNFSRKRKWTCSHSEQRLLDITPLSTTLPRRWIGTQHHSCHWPRVPLSPRATSPLTWSRASVQQTAQGGPQCLTHKIQTHPDDIPLPRHSSLRTLDIEPECL